MNNESGFNAPRGSFSACFSALYYEVTTKNEKWKKKPETQNKVVKWPYFYALYVTLSYYMHTV